MLTRDEIDEAMRRLADERAGLCEKLVEKRRDQVVAHTQAVRADQDVKAIEDRLDAIDSERASLMSRYRRAS